MTADKFQIPAYARVTILLIGLFAFFAILYIAKSIIIPLVFATIIAILLNPVVDFLVRLKLNRVVAIAITLLLTFVVIFSFASLLISQISRFADSLPVLSDKFTIWINQTIIDASDYFDINPQRIHEWIAKTQGKIINSSTAALGQTLVIVGSTIVFLFLIPVYIFLILFYQPLLLEFIHRLFPTTHQTKVSEVVKKIKTVIQRYLSGLIIEAVLMAVMEVSVLLILGIDYALLLGIIGALINIIPYVGGLVGVALPMAVALATKSPISALYIFVLYYFIQLIDNNIIVPKIVASRVKINALFSIIVVIAGNVLWGIPGMFLSIPLLAIFKLICDHIDSLKPLGFLLGDTMPTLLIIPKIFTKIKTKTA
jgi:predicted PurR-regulated permease PerM